MVKQAVAVRHVHFEDLGTFEAVLASAGYEVSYRDVGVHDLGTLEPVEPELLVVLGGPIGVYEDEAYPFLERERDLLKARLAANRPTLGICLGAQLIAAALGARVYPSGVKEIGFAPIALTEAERSGPLRHLANVPVLHWHGDTFDLPEGARHLASTKVCFNQAFALGPNVLGLQFHPEPDLSGGLERWLIGHAAELAAAHIDPRALRAEALRIAPALRGAAQRMLTAWLAELKRDEDVPRVEP